MVFRIGFLLFNQVTQLDFTGPAQFLSRIPDVQIYYIVKENKETPISTDCGFRILADTTFQECPKLDIICIPGGAGVHNVIEDEETLQFLRTIAQDAQYITSVCTGSFVLAAAGLLVGYEATSYWAYRDILTLFGAIPKNQRVVKDRNRITGGGVTAGIDFALFILQELRGAQETEIIQIQLEYNPSPLIGAGTPDEASIEIMERVTERMLSRGLNDRKQHIERIAKKLNYA